MLDLITNGTITGQEILWHIFPKIRLNGQYVHDQLTLSMLYAYCEHYVLTLGCRDVGNVEEFMKKLPGDEAQKLAQIRAAYAYMMVHPGAKMMAPGKESSRRVW